MQTFDDETCEIQHCRVRFVARCLTDARVNRPGKNVNVLCVRVIEAGVLMSPPVVTASHPQTTHSTAFRLTPAE